MFGKNKIRKQELKPDGELWVTEVFATLQGEGPHAGRPAIFVRLAGCNLACTFCDTEFEKGQVYRHPLQLVGLITGIWAQVLHSQIRPKPLVVLTGGEPLRQNVVPLISDLVETGYTVQIETAGTLWIPQLAQFGPDELAYVVSPKTGRINPEIEARASAYKYIIRDTENSDEDGLPVFSTQVVGRPLTLARPPKRLLEAGQVYVQPCDEYDHSKNESNRAAALYIAMRHGYRVCLQLHKILGLP